MTVAVFTFVLLLGNVLKEILALFVNRQATLGLVFHGIALLIPFVLVFALPMGMLTATLLVFGRFSADQELTAVRANGVSLLASVSPVLLLACALCALSAWLNLYIAPASRVAFKELLMKAQQSSPASLISEGRFISDIPGYLVYVGKVRGSNLEDIVLCQIENTQVVSRIRAASGIISQNQTNHQMTLQLFQVLGLQYDPEHAIWNTINTKEASPTFDIKQTKASDNDLDYSDMTFNQLLEEKRKMELLSFDPRPSKRLPPELLKEQLHQASLLKHDLLMPITVQLHRQVAFSFACLGFTLVGIPLGIRAHRRETSVGIALALVLVAFYYGFIILGVSLETRADLGPHLLMWIPNFLFQVIGSVMLWRANRGI